MGKISVLLVDDHAVVRQGLRMLLQNEPGVEVVGEAENGQEAVSIAEQTSATVVVMDVALPVMNGVEATRIIHKRMPATKVLVLSSYSDDETVKAMLQAGATGFLVKQTAASDLLKAIREVHAGNSFFSPTIARRIRDQTRASLKSAYGERPASTELTPRESQVLQLVAEGYSNKEMAVELGISVKTVEKHRQQVMDKLSIHDTAGLTRHAISKGLVSREFSRTESQTAEPGGPPQATEAPNLEQSPIPEN